MICPRCRFGDTRVTDSRPEENGATIRRRRVCEAVGCGHRFQTWETTTNVIARRHKEAERSARRRAANPDYHRARDRARDPERRLRNQAKAEAAETGEPLEQILARWGLSAPAQKGAEG